MKHEDDQVEYRRRLEAKFEPAQIRATLGFAGLYQIAHEMLKRSVLVEVREFYSRGFDETGTLYDDERYQRQVLALEPKNRFRASLLWLVEAEAITLAQADRLDEIYAHRHALSHELINYVIDPDFELDLDLFNDAVSILKAIRRFWTSIEMDLGSFDHLDDDVDLDEAVPLSLMVLQQCIDAYLDGMNS